MHPIFIQSWLLNDLQCSLELLKCTKVCYRELCPGKVVLGQVSTEAILNSSQTVCIYVAVICLKSEVRPSYFDGDTATHSVPLRLTKSMFDIDPLTANSSIEDVSCWLGRSWTLKKLWTRCLLSRKEQRRTRCMQCLGCNCSEELLPTTLTDQHYPHLLHVSLESCWWQRSVLWLTCRTPLDGKITSPA